MMNDLQQWWPEILADLGSADMYWQLLLIALSILFARLAANLLLASVTKHTVVDWQMGLGGLKRALFPLLSLVLLYIAQQILHIWCHTSLISLAISAFWALAIIRLAVYLLRYIFAPSGWLSTTENVLSRTVWLLYLLHIFGVLPRITSMMQQIGFSLGKSNLNLLILIQGLLTIVITLFVSLSLSRWLENRLMGVEQVNSNVRVALSRVIRVLISMIAVMLGMSAVGIDITLLSVFGGALGVGLGFGLQKIASNYVSGFIILLDDSMHIGDIITVDGHYGVVSELRFRFLVLRKLDGTQVVIPHETIMTSSVINHSHAHGKTRVSLPIQVAFDSDVAQVMQLLKDCALAHPRVLKDMPVDPLISGFGDNGIQFNLMFWVIDPEDGTASVQSDIYLAIWQQFQQHDILIPYPQRDIRVTQQASNAAKSGAAGKKNKTAQQQSSLHWDDVY
jgi:small-conductance mechanosensitive channel